MIRINLVPQRVTKKQIQVRQMAIIAGSVLLAALLTVLLMHQSINSRIAKVVQDTKDTRDKLQQLDATVKKIEQFKLQKEELKKKLDVINQLIQNRSGPVKLMAELAVATPQKLWLSSISIQGQTLTLRGISDQESTIVDFAQRLKQQEHIADVEIKDLTGKEGTPPQGTLRGYVEFTLTSTVKLST